MAWKEKSKGKKKSKQMVEEKLNTDPGHSADTCSFPLSRGRFGSGSNIERGEQD